MTWRCAGSGQTRHQVIDIDFDARLDHAAAGQLFQIPLDVLAPEPDHFVCGRATVREFATQRAQRHGVRARFDYRDDTFGADLVPQGLEGCADSGGMMGEVVIHPDAIAFGK